jgi:hypothetical protein
MAFEHCQMLINALRNAIRNAIRINWVNFRKNATLYALKNVNFMEKATLYALEKLYFTKIQRYKIWKR